MLHPVRRHLVPPGPPVLPPGAARRGSGVEAGAEEDERAVAVSGGQVFDADAARVIAVGADDHDVVAVAQVFGCRRWRRAPRGPDSRRACRPPRRAIRVQTYRVPFGVAGVLVVVRRRCRTQYSCAATMIPKIRLTRSAATASAPAIRNRRLRLMGATGSRCGRPCRRSRGRAGKGARSASASPAPSGSAASAVSAASSPGNVPPSQPVSRAQRSRSSSREPAERRLVVHVGAGLEVIAGRVGALGQLAAETAAVQETCSEKRLAACSTVTTCDAPRTPSTSAPPSGWSSRQVASGSGAGRVERESQPAPGTSAGVTAS